MKSSILLVPVLSLVVACGSSGSGDSVKPAASGKPAAADSAKKGDAPAGGAALQNPEENYVAAATKIGCLGISAVDADALAKDRAAILKDHGYTEDSWKAASKQLGGPKGDSIVKAMETKCPD